MATKWAKINLQTSFRPIWNPENQGYKIGYEKSYQEQQLRPKNGSEKCATFIRQYCMWGWDDVVCDGVDGSVSGGEDLSKL